MSLCDLEIHANPQPFAQLPEGVPPLRAFYLYLTGGCNLMCLHCWITPRFADGRPDPQECIDPDLLFAAVREAGALGLAGAKLTGGEPFLHPRFEDIVAGLSKLGIEMNMETNGTLLTKELARWLKNETKVGFISVSLDDDDPALHDAFRGVKGAFEAALRGLDHLVGAGYENVQVIMSLHKGNVDAIDGVVALSAAHGAASVKFNPINGNGRGRQMMLRRETFDVPELLAIERYVYGKLKEKAAIRRLVLDLPPAIRSFRALMETGGSTGDCGILNILGILGSGEIAMCGIGRTTPSLIYGRLGDSISDIWLNHPKLLQLRGELKDWSGYPGICGDCILARLCRTGCVADNYREGGRMVCPGRQCEEAQRQGLFPNSRRRTEQ